MPCGCNSSSNPAEYVYTDIHGHQSVWHTEIQALNAQVNAGGGGTVTTR